MIVQSRSRVPHSLFYNPNLLQDIRHIAVSEMSLIQRFKGLRHINPIQPDLVRVYFFMPERALRRAWLLFQCSMQHLRRLTVFLLTRHLIHRKQHPAFIDIIQLAFFRIKGQDLTVFPDKMVCNPFGKGSIT